jgi:hypothetical protein
MKIIVTLAALLPSLVLAQGLQRGPMKAIAPPQKAISRGPCTMLPATTNVFGDRVSPTGWTATQAGVSSDVDFAPDGSFRADKFTETAVSAGHTLQRSVTIAASTAYVYSFYAKAAERTQISFYGSSGLSGINGRANLSNCTLASGTGTVASAGNGWCRVYGTATSSGTAAILWLQLYNGGGTYLGTLGSGVLVNGMQLETGSTPNPFVDTANGVRVAGCY